MLAFLRDGLLCVFNLSPEPVAVHVDGAGSASGPSAALDVDALTLDPNGWAFLGTDGIPAIRPA